MNDRPISLPIADQRSIGSPGEIIPFLVFGFLTCVALVMAWRFEVTCDLTVMGGGRC